MKATLAKTLFMSSIFLAVTSGIFAQETTDEATAVQENVQENVIVDSCPLSAQKRQWMEEQRKAEQEQAEQILKEAIENPSLDISGTVIPIKTHNLTALVANQMNTTAASYCPYVYHWIDSFPQRNIIKLEDGSEWIFDKSAADILQLWRSNHTVFITPKGTSLWGSNYTYVLTNTDKGNSVYVNPFLGPIAFGQNSTWIAGINSSMGQIYVLNGLGERTVWEIANADLELFKDWQVNHTIIFGQNDSWLWTFSSFDHIIINVNMNHYVRARQISSSY